MPTVAAIVYVRVSTAEQADQAHNLPTQHHKLEHRCKGEGWPILKTFTDAGESARSTDRPQFPEMMSYCRKHKTKVMHVASSTQRSRSVGDADDVQAFKQLRITPASCDERIEDSASGWLVAPVPITM